MSETPERFKDGFTWEVFNVSRASKEPLYRFVIDGLQEAGCSVLHTSAFDKAPLFVVFDTSTGERYGVLVYAFLSNTKVTKNRPTDEHRFQIKYGSDLSRSFKPAIDQRELVTTLFLGIDPERDLFFAVDPAMNSPTPMSRSIEYKSDNVERTHENGWHSWERDRRPAKTSHREAAELEDRRIEIVTGGCKARLLNLVQLERLAIGLDPGERHLVADKLTELVEQTSSPQHALLDELAIDQSTLLDLIQGAARLKMAVRGWVAEEHLYKHLTAVEGVSHCCRIEQDGKADVSLRWKDGQPLLIECKNALRTRYADGRIKVDFQRTRAAKGDRCSRYYSPNDFAILAACTHSVTERWEFELALTTDLKPHSECAGKLSSSIGIAAPVFSSNIADVLERWRMMSIR